MFRKLLRALGCVWLFCGFLIAASVDRMPDPPAIQAHAEGLHSHILVDADLQPACAANHFYAMPISQGGNPDFLTITTHTYQQKLLACASNASDNSPPML